MNDVSSRRERQPFPPGLLPLLGLQALNGFNFAAWFPYVATVARLLRLSAPGLGTALFGLPAGLVVGAGLGSRLQKRFGVRQLICGAMAFYCAGMALPGLVSWLAPGLPGRQYLLAAALFLPGVANGAFDPAIGYEVNRFQAVMKREMQGYSFAVFFAAQLGQAGLATAAIGLHVQPVAYLIGTATVGVIATSLLAVRLLRAPDLEPHAKEESNVGTGSAPRRRQAVPWLVALSVMFLFGGATAGIWSDWHGVYLRGPGIGAAAGLAALGYVIFQAAAVTALLIGPRLVDRFGRLPIFLASAAGAGSGAYLIVNAHALRIALIGAGLLGLGQYVGPLAQSSAGEDSTAVTVVTVVGYVGFTAAPAVMGYLAGAFSLRAALTVTLVGGAVAIAVFALSIRTRLHAVDARMRSQSTG